MQCHHHVVGICCGILLLLLRSSSSFSVTTTYAYPRSFVSPWRLGSSCYPKQSRLLMAESSSNVNDSNNNVFAVPADQLQENLSPSERTVVNVVRQSSPSVGFVTSVWPVRRGSNTNGPNTKDGLPPMGRSLGSGSCFVVQANNGNGEDDVYFATNYHVIQAAYEILQQQQQQKARNQTNCFPWMPQRQRSLQPPPQVYVRINSASSQFQPCEICHVQPQLDLALLKLSNTTTSNSNSESLKSLEFGSSSDLLVGQGLIAIGSPFALETSVSTGVVSALGRQVTTSSSSTMMMTTNTLTNCIQTDSAINPGNSGGPLFNFQGQVVGMNTAILTTSGSSSGVGFAVPSDSIKEVIQDYLVRSSSSKSKPYLGVALVRHPFAVATTHTTDQRQKYHWISRVEPESPAALAGIQALTLDPTTQTMVAGDAIVAWNGRLKDVSPNNTKTPNESYSYRDLQHILSKRSSVGEQVSLTVQNAVTQQRRVVYVTLDHRPAADHHEE